MDKEAIEKTYPWVRFEELEHREEPWGNLYTNKAARELLPKIKHKIGHGNDLVLLCQVDGTITFNGSSNYAVIGGLPDRAAKIGLNFWGNHSRFIFGVGSTSNGMGAEFSLKDSLIIGNDCMLSSDVAFRVNDLHPIFDINGNLLNGGRPIHVADHVWIGQRATIMKGVSLRAGSIVAGGAVVTKNAPRASVVAGVPAKVIKRQVSWTRSRFPDEDEKALAAAYIKLPPTLWQRVMKFLRLQISKSKRANPSMT